MNDAELIAAAQTAEETLARIVTALDPVLQMIRAFEGVDAHERSQRLNVDPNGTPTDETEAPVGWTLCICGEALPPSSEFVECWRCHRVTCTTIGERDGVADAAMKPDQSRRARATLAKHINAIDRATAQLLAECRRWCRPSKPEVEALRKAAEGEVEQDHRDYDAWCKVHRRHGQNEPLCCRLVRVVIR